MIEHRMPIPSRAYNAAVGGHVCGPEDIDFGQKVVHLIKYDKDGNEVSFESQVTQANKIYVIHDDFTLSSNVTIPANCVLEFDGGSISGAYTLTGTNTGIQAGLVKIFNTDITLAGTWNIVEAYPNWFGAVGDGVNDDTAAIQKTIDINTEGGLIIYIQKGTYLITSNNQWGLVPRANRKIVGVGDVTLKLNESIANIFSNLEDFYRRPTRYSGIHDVTFENLTLDSNAQNLEDPWADSSISGDNYNFGIYLIFAKNITIKNCHFKNSYYGGLNLLSVDGQHISDCTFNDIGVFPCRITGYAAFGSDQGDNVVMSSNIVIERCRVNNCGYVYRINGGMNNGVTNSIQENFTIRNNNFSNCDAGISFYNGKFENINICNNKFSNIKKRIIALDDSITTEEVYNGVLRNVYITKNTFNISSDIQLSAATLFNFTTTSLLLFAENSVKTELNYPQGSNVIAINAPIVNSQGAYIETAYIIFENNNFNLLSFDRFAIFHTKVNTEFSHNHLNMPNVRAHYILADGSATETSLICIGNRINKGGQSFISGSFGTQIIKNNVGVADV